MKKIYFQPACIVVQLGTCKMMAESLTIYTPTGSEDDEVISDGSEILTKENKSIWYNEW